MLRIAAQYLLMRAKNEVQMMEKRLEKQKFRILGKRIIDFRKEKRKGKGRDVEEANYSVKNLSEGSYPDYFRIFALRSIKTCTQITLCQSHRRPTG